MRGDHRRRLPLLAHVAAVALALGGTACSRDQPPATPAEMTARGDELLRDMSRTLKDARSFSFKVAESHERVRRNGTKVPYTLERTVVVRRPDRLRVHTTGSDGRDVEITYDGRAVTVIGRAHQVYAQIDAPPLLDGMLDLVSERFDLRLAVADFLYASPYESFSSGDEKGGWVRRTTLDARTCEELSYTMPQVAYTISVTTSTPRLPCAAVITYQAEPGTPVTRLTFREWQIDVDAPESRFTPTVPAGFERIPVVERIPKAEIAADAAKAMSAGAMR